MAFSMKLKKTFRRENVSFLIFQRTTYFSEKKSLSVPNLTNQSKLLQRWKNIEHRQLMMLRAIVGFAYLFLNIFFKIPISSKNLRKLKIFLPD